MSGRPTRACALIGDGSNITRALPGASSGSLRPLAIRALSLPAIRPAHRVRPLAGPMAGSGGIRETAIERVDALFAPRPTVAISPHKERDALTRGFRSASGRSQRTCSGAVRAGPSLPPTVSWGHWHRRPRDPARFLIFTVARADFGRLSNEGPVSAPGLSRRPEFQAQSNDNWLGGTSPARPAKTPALRA